MEFKVGDSVYRKSTDDQVMDYALDLKYFHEASKNRLIVPVCIPTEAEAVDKLLGVAKERKIPKNEVYKEYHEGSK